MSHVITDRVAMKDFVLGGRAYFTLVNKVTGNRVTYCVEADKDEAGTYIVRSFTGSDNSDRKAYSYLGNIKADGTYIYAGPQAAVDALLVAAEEAKNGWLINFCRNIRQKLSSNVALTTRQQAALAENVTEFEVVSSALAPDNVKVKGFTWFWRMLVTGKGFPPEFDFYHEGRCARCARRLTVPESIISGFGPECLKRIDGSILPTTQPI